jgi:hypothetical protein
MRKDATITGVVQLPLRMVSAESGGGTASSEAVFLKFFESVPNCRNLMVQCNSLCGATNMM